MVKKIFLSKTILWIKFFFKKILEKNYLVKTKQKSLNIKTKILFARMRMRTRQVTAIYTLLLYLLVYSVQSLKRVHTYSKYPHNSIISDV